MKKLISLRAYLKTAVPFLKDNPDKLLIFAETGSLEDTPRVSNLSFEYSYTATLVITDFSHDPDTVIVPILAWLKQNQPQRGERKAADFEAEILDNDSVDLQIKLQLSEFVKVTDNGNDTVSTAHLGEPIYVGGIASTGDPMSEWETHNG